MKEIMILGNGVSRQRDDIKKIINNYKKEIVVCNDACFEYIHHKIDYVFSVHLYHALKAFYLKKMKKLNYKIITNKKLQKKDMLLIEFDWNKNTIYEFDWKLIYNQEINEYIFDYLFGMKLDDILNEFISFNEYGGYCTGNEAIKHLIKEGYDKFILVGFDFGGLDIYKGNEIMPGNNFISQFNEIKNKNKNIIFEIIK